MILFIAHSRAEEGEGIIQGKFKDLTRSPVPVTITKVIDGTTLQTKDSTIYELPNLLVPDTANTLVEKTQKRLTELTNNAACASWLTRKSNTGRTNRMGHALTELECGKDKTWISGQLVAEGLAIVWPQVSNPEMADDLLKLESAARKSKKGLWADGTVKIQTPESVKQHMNSRQIVEGKIYNVALVKNTVYLNFEADWKQDFTIAIPSDLRRDFSKKNISLQSLKGQPVRVRGWVREYNGPVIELENTGQLEILENLPKLKAPETPAEPVAGMHTIKSPTPPSIEKPEPPKVEEVKNDDN